MPFNFESEYRTILESQERMITTSSSSYERAYEPPPTSYHEAYESSTSNWNQPGGYFGQEDHYDYGERYQPWNMEYEYGTSYPSPSYDEEETCNMECYYGAYYDEEDQSPQASYEEYINNMLKKILENQEKGEIKMQGILHSLSTMIEANETALGSGLEEITTHEKSINNKLSQKIEEQDEESTPLYNTNTCEALINDLKSDVEGDAQIKDEFQQEAEDSINELEAQLGCIVDENLVIRYEEKAEPIAFMSYSANVNEEELGFVEISFEDLGDKGLVVECTEKTRESWVVIDELSPEDGEEKHVVPVAKEETKGEVFKESEVIHCEEPSKEVEEEESPANKPFGYHFGILSTRELKVYDPRKILFEKIRMNEFRGWFYDEYDPGDPCCCNKAFCGPVLA